MCFSSVRHKVWWQQVEMISWAVPWGSRVDGSVSEAALKLVQRFVERERSIVPTTDAVMAVFICRQQFWYNKLFTVVQSDWQLNYWMDRVRNSMVTSEGQVWNSRSKMTLQDWWDSKTGRRGDINCTCINLTLHIEIFYLTLIFCWYWDTFCIVRSLICLCKRTEKNIWHLFSSYEDLL